MAMMKKRLSHHASIATLTGRYAPLQGYLEKRSTKGKWQRRWFEAHDAYLTYRHDEHAKKIQGVIDLRSCGRIFLTEEEPKKEAGGAGGAEPPDKGAGHGDGEIVMCYFSVQLEARTYELRIPTPWTEDTQFADVWVAGLLERKRGAAGKSGGSDKTTIRSDNNDDGGWGASSGGSFSDHAASTFHEYDPSTDIADDVHHATKKIQSVVRARKARKHTHEKRKKHHASKKIQSAMRGRKARKQTAEMKRVDTATKKIQSVMRGRKVRKEAQDMRRTDTAQIMLATKNRISRKSTSERLTASFEAEEAKVRAQLEVFYHDREEFKKERGAATDSLSSASGAKAVARDSNAKTSSPSSTRAVVAFEMDQGGVASVGMPMDAASGGANGTIGSGGSGCWGCCSCFLPSSQDIK